jgi:hypothetical protein
MESSILAGQGKNKMTLELNGNSLEKELALAMSKFGINAKQVGNKDGILSKIQEAFIDGNPRAWWESMKFKPKIFYYGVDDDDAFLHIVDIAPACSSSCVWFIADDDNERKFVFDVPLDKITDILKECRYFEYYIVPYDFSWMLAENDHGDLLLVVHGQNG